MDIATHKFTDFNLLEVIFPRLSHHLLQVVLLIARLYSYGLFGVLKFLSINVLYTALEQFA